MMFLPARSYVKTFSHNALLFIFTKMMLFLSRIIRVIYARSRAIASKFPDFGLDKLPQGEDGRKKHI
jgi:hypothetical protein